MKKIFLISFLSVFILLGAGCSSSNDWTGFYYPDINNMGDESTWIIQPGLESLDACRTWAKLTVIKRGDRSPDYECGYKCKYNEDLGLSVCKETKQ